MGKKKDDIKWASGFPSRGVDAAEAFKRISAIAKKRGVASAEDILEDAVSETSPLHDLFTWDDSEAAHAYRLTEARNAARSLRITIDVDEGKEVHGFFHVTTEGGSGYLDARLVKADDFLKDQVVAHALRMLRSFEKRLSEFNGDVPALRPVVRATKTAITKLEKAAEMELAHAANS